MEREHLHLLIHEEIFRLSSEEIIDAADGKNAVVETSIEIIDEEEKDEAVPKVAEPEPKQIKEPEAATEDEVKKSGIKREPIHESPEIPVHEVGEPRELPFAVFHDSHDEAQIDLLHKIISACRVSEKDYKIFNNGFDQSVKFKKALVFVPEAKAFYTPIPYKGSEFLCSKPLSILIDDQQEKGKLWVSLQKFVL